MRRLIIVTDSAVIGAATRDAITAFLRGKGWSVWHWFADLWLIDQAPMDVNFGLLREEIIKTIPGIVHLMIMSADGKMDHAGTVPSASIEWIKEHWQRRPLNPS
jgi:hypothetical protein